MTRASRGQVLGYRVAVQHVEQPAEDPVREGVLLGGVQDVPPGRTAGVALRVRGATVDPGQLVLVHSVRGAPHLHVNGDVEGFAAALGVLEVADLAKEVFGAIGLDVGLPWAMEQVARAMRDVCGDGRARTKGELSTALNEVVDERLRPWCASCGVHHVQDALFRYATLQAGLAMVLEGAGFRYVRRPERKRPDPVESQRMLVRRFLRLCGPCRPEDVGRWLALRPAAARRLWRELEDQLVPVVVDGRESWMHQEDLQELAAMPPAAEVRLLPAYDPITELADRELLLPDRAHRAAVWRAVGNPGVLLVRGEIAGTWRQRATKRQVNVSIKPFTSLSPADRRAATQHADTIGEATGVPVQTEFTP